MCHSTVWALSAKHLIHHALKMGQYKVLNADLDKKKNHS